MFHRSIATVIWLMLFSLLSFAQNKVPAETEVWPQYYLQVPFKSKWTAAADYSHRYSGLFAKKTQWIGRVGLDYKFNDKLSVAAGYAYSEYFSANGVRMENRPWQQVQLNASIKGLKFNHRLRLEERFQKDKTSERFNYRLRYQLLVTLPVIKEQRLSLYLSDEPMINFGTEITGNMFDQNRVQAGLQVKLAKYVFLSPAYLYTYQYQASKDLYRNIHILRTGLTYKR